MKLEGLDHVALTVSDLNKSIAWYRDVLGLERRHADVWGDVPTFMCAGSTGLALFPADVPFPAVKPDATQTLVMRHLAFRADRNNFEAAQKHLKELGVEFAFQDHEISHSIYFSDPDGHRLEITTYEL
jgi:catechol 2,3-dioxygenase-like lactoylglutathione lyase family enzyme